MMKSGTVPFRVDSNIPLQNLFSQLIRGCSHAHSQLDIDAIDRFYRPDRKPRPRTSDSSTSDSDSSPPHRPRARHASGDEISQYSDPEELEKVLRRGREDQARRAPTTDLYKTGAYLSSPRNLIDLFSDHSQNASDIDDKAPDQISARQYEDIYAVPQHKGSRSITILSTSASFAPEESLPADGLPEHDKLIAGRNSRTDPPPPSSSLSFGVKFLTRL